MPNNGTKIYTETINGVKYGIDLAADVYKVLGVSPTQTGGAYCDRVCANEHGKINKNAKYKPYRIDTFQDPTEAQRKAINYGLVDATHSGVLYIPNTFASSLVGSTTIGTEQCWALWQPPVPGQDWHRPTDFDNYNHKAVPFVTALKIYSSAGQQYHRPIYTTPSQSGQTAYLTAEVELDGSINAEIRYTDLTVEGKSVGDLYLTMLLLSQDSGGAWHYAAQSERPIKDYVGRASVQMITSNIPDLGDHQSDINIIIVCLADEMNINADHTYSGNAIPSKHYSLDINSMCFQQILVNNGMALKGNGTDGGAAVMDYVDVYGRFKANPLQGTSILARSDGSAVLQITDSTGALVTWAGTSPSGKAIPNNLMLTIGAELTRVSGTGLPSKTFDCVIDLEPKEGGGSGDVVLDDTGIYIMGNIEIGFSADELHGDYTAKLTLSVGVKQQGATTTYSFKDAGNHANALQKVVNLSNVTFY